MADRFTLSIIRSGLDAIRQYHHGQSYVACHQHVEGPREVFPGHVRNGFFNPMTKAFQQTCRSKCRVPAFRIHRHAGERFELQGDDQSAGIGTHFLYSLAVL
jgi:hypothetical protein